MVAACVLLDLCLAHRAKLDAAALLNPAFKLVFHGLLAADSCMVFVPALEADFRMTSVAFNSLGVQALGTCGSLAALLGTPAH